MNVTQSVSHGSQWATVAVDTEHHCPVLVSSDPFDERVLHPGIPQVVDERVAGAVEDLPLVSDAHAALVATEPLGRGVAELASHGFQFGEQAPGSDGSDALDMLQQAQVDQDRVEGRDSPAACVLQVLTLPAVVDADAQDALLLDEVVYSEPTNPVVFP